jgi:hypothetical protein
MRRTRVTVGSLAIASALTACAGVSFTKAGESDAKNACNSIGELQDDASVSQVMDAIARAEVLSVTAAAANDDYIPLKSAVQAFRESLIGGSENLAQVSWSNLAEVCNSL